MPRGKRKVDETFGCKLEKQSSTCLTSRYPSEHVSTSASGSKLLAALEGTTSLLAKPAKRKNKEEPYIGKYESTVALDVPAPKKKRKTKDPDAPVPEKRGAIFKKKCPQNILERVDRIISQRYVSKPSDIL